MTARPAPRPNPDVLFTEIDDGTGILLHLQTKFYYTLNPTGVLVWKSIVEGRETSAAVIAARIAASFRVDPGAAEKDVVAVLDEMLGDGLLLVDAGK